MVRPSSESRNERKCDLVHILQDVVENKNKNIRTEHPQRNIWLKMEEKSVEVCGDEKEVRKKIEECLNEALKYDPTSDVTICLEKGETVAYITGSPYSSKQQLRANGLAFWDEFLLYYEE